MNLVKNYTSNKPDHSTYGGYICFADFNTNGRGDEKNHSEIAKRIASDMRFDEQCRKNIENKKKNGSCNYAFKIEEN